MQGLAIGEVARAAGVRQSAIRYYESEGLLPLSGRMSGRRVFRTDAIDTVRVIRTARELGFSLEDIRLLLSGFSTETPPSERWQVLARRKVAEVDRILERASAMKRLLEKGLRCDCVSMNDCILHDCNPPVALGRRNARS
jgi:MerR family redox-sensitive transcriptional activator SoxR